MYRRIRDLREDHDLKQVCYSNYEIGKRGVPADVLIKLSQFYNTSVDYLLELTDDPRPYPRKK
ncbi:helix-turn-helix domain-containing protein [Acutalibacter muris]|nr:helix-turn-helix transcriptional regulator [Acutalibacter muris]